MSFLDSIPGVPWQRVISGRVREALQLGYWIFFMGMHLRWVISISLPQVITIEKSLLALPAIIEKMIKDRFGNGLAEIRSRHITVNFQANSRIPTVFVIASVWLIRVLARLEMSGKPVKIHEGLFYVKFTDDTPRILKGIW
jgi:hypothetical protein